MFVSVGDMMLRGGNIRKDRPTKATLVSNNKVAEHTSHIVPRELRHNLMVNKFSFGIGNVGTTDSIVDDITGVFTSGYIVSTTGIGINPGEFVTPDGSKFRNINFEESVADGNFLKQIKRRIDNFVDKLKLTNTEGLDVTLELLDPRVVLLFVPIGCTKPSSEHRSALFGFSRKRLQPLKPADL